MFGAMAIWDALPDRIDRDNIVKISRGIVLAPALNFFLAEIGDKSELCAAVLTAHSGAVGLVLIGTNASVLIANVPLVLFASTAGK